MRLYNDLAPWFHLLTAPADYAVEAAWIWPALLARAQRPPRTLLELGSGGGNLASHLKAHVTPTLTDISQPMLDVSRTINPELEHLQGDMRTLRLGRTFDAVLVHDAIMYATTESDLAATILTAAEHLSPGGVAVLVPDFVRESFETSTSQCGNDEVSGPDGKARSLRYLEWRHDPDPSDTELVVDFACMLREADGSVQVVSDRHHFGLFTRADWMRLIEAAGLRADREMDDFDRDVFFGVRG